jgi:hypothetical protein
MFCVGKVKPQIEAMIEKRSILDTNLLQIFALGILAFHLTIQGTLSPPSKLVSLAS